MPALKVWDGADWVILGGGGTGALFPMGFAGSGTPTTGTDKVRRVPLPSAMTVVHLGIMLGTPPSGGSFTVTVRRSSNNGSSFPDVIATLSVTTGNRYATTTSFTTSALLANDILNLSIDSVNGAADWNVSITASV